MFKLKSMDCGATFIFRVYPPLSRNPYQPCCTSLCFVMIVQMGRYLVKDGGLTRKPVFNLCPIDCGTVNIMAVLTRGVASCHGGTWSRDVEVLTWSRTGFPRITKLLFKMFFFPPSIGLRDD